MSAPPAPRELIAFDGVVECELGRAAISLMLRGFERHGAPAGRVAAEALFAAATAIAPGLAALPAQLHEVQVFELPAQRILLSARELQMELLTHSVQVHRDASHAFFGAVPPPRVPLARRLGWTLLLLALRVPGAGRLLAQLRGGR